MTIVLLFAIRFAVACMTGDVTAPVPEGLTPQNGVITAPADPATGGDSNVPILPDAPKPGT